VPQFFARGAVEDRHLPRVGSYAMNGNLCIVRQGQGVRVELLLPRVLVQREMETSIGGLESSR